MLASDYYRTNADECVLKDFEQSPDNFSLTTNNTENMKTPEIICNSKQNTFQFNTSYNLHSTKYTKRTLLSNFARLFDPLGFLGLDMTTAKLIMQSLLHL